MKKGIFKFFELFLEGVKRALKRKAEETVEFFVY